VQPASKQPASKELPAAAGYAAAIVAASLFAWLGPLSRWAYERGMEPLPFVAWRAGIGAAVLLAVIAIVARRGRALIDPRRLRRGELSALALASTMALTLNLSIFGAFDRLPIAVALIGFYTYPAMVAAVAILLGREPASRPVLVSLLLALAGMVAVLVGNAVGNAGAPGGLALDALGVGLALGAAASQTVFVTISRDGYARVPAEQATTTILGATLIGTVVLGVPAGLGEALSEPLRRPELLPIVLAAGAAGAGIPSLLFLTAIRRIGGTRAGILMLLEPVIAVGLAAWLLGEGLAPIQVGGAVAVLAAAVLLQRSHRAGAAEASAASASGSLPATAPEAGLSSSTDPTFVGAHEAVPGPPPTR
jgi:drug/metabolite transporter (DMT)-like permease